MKETFSRMTPHLNEGDTNLDKSMTVSLRSDDNSAKT